MRVASQNQSQRSRKSSRGRKGRTGSSARVSGIHNRRDKRFFCDKPRPTLEDAVHQSQVSDVSDESPATDGGRSAWNALAKLEPDLRKGDSLYVQGWEPGWEQEEATGDVRRDGVSAETSHRSQPRVA